MKTIPLVQTVPTESPLILYPTAIPIPKNDLHVKCVNNNSQVNGHSLIIAHTTASDWPVLLTLTTQLLLSQ